VEVGPANQGGRHASDFMVANGYVKIDGKSVLVCAHATVGAQHAAMALYDAWCDHVPVFLVSRATAPSARGAAPRLAPNTLPLEGFMTWLRNGTPGWTIATGMPAFSASVLSDAELADVRTYLASLPPRAIAVLPLLAP
jgi:hypothetical protein